MVPPVPLLLCSSLRKRPAYLSGERVVQHIQAQRQDPEQYQEVVLEDNQKVC